MQPFVPSDPAALIELEALIRRDFEAYIEEIQSYFRCLDDERVRAFEEAKEVSQQYGQFLKRIERQ